ncbi:hypothetical protein [Actinoplanes sp. NPDC048796]|uniref:hypothetical protein n=1 Tax=Actinoplanes sp. NPDC048796 TaxID=3155640 RepID=UPI0033FB6B89
MGISVRVVEYSGQIVKDGGRYVEAVLEATSSDVARYPLLAGVDEYDDTTFNPRQAVMLIAELEQLTAMTDDQNLHEAISQLITLAELLVPAPRRPRHRRLVFNGD